MNTENKNIEENEINNDLNKSDELGTNHSNKVIKNIIIVAISNIIKLLSGILVAFLIPKIMGETNYGYYKTFTLYLSYVGILHFGFCDGIYLIYGGKKKEDLNPKDFRTYSKFLILFQIIVSLLIIIPAIAFIKTDYGFIFLFIGINVITYNITNYYQIISQITGNFKELSIRNIIQAVLTIISVLVLALLYYFKIIDIIEYKIYVIITSSISLFLAIWYLFTYRKITFGESEKIELVKTNISNYFKVGFILLIANLVSILILAFDRQFVNILVNMGYYTMGEYGVYSFAYNMLNLITTVISAISIVLYPTIKSYSREKLESDYNKLISIIAMLTAFCMISYFPLCFIVNTWLPKYIDSLMIFRVILPGLVLSSCVTMIMYNYYKALGKHTLYFIISIIVLLISILANIIAFSLGKQLVWISGASVIVMAIWYFISERILVKKINIKPIKNSIYILLIVIFYYLVTFLIENIYIGFASYLVVYLLITIIFYRKTIVILFRRMN